jgi:uncharacterized protein
MGQTTKPIPVVNPWAKPFWDAAREKRLVIQKCSDCGKTIFYPRIACPDCFSDHVKWVEASGKGSIYTFTVVKNNAPSAFIQDIPYVVAVIRLDEGVQMLSNVVDCDPETLHCDMLVEVVFEKLTTEFTLPKFRPVAL